MKIPEHHRRLEKKINKQNTSNKKKKTVNYSVIMTCFPGVAKGFPPPSRVPTSDKDPSPPERFLARLGPGIGISCFSNTRKMAAAPLTRPFLSPARVRQGPGRRFWPVPARWPLSGPPWALARRYRGSLLRNPECCACCSAGTRRPHSPRPRRPRHSLPRRQARGCSTRE